MFVEEVLGIGQFGKVVKAQKQSEVKASKDPKTYACKIMDISNISKEDMDCIEKEVRLHDKVVNEHCIRLYQTIKTSSNIYMVIEYCNGSDLAVLLSVRKRLSQMEVSMILRQVVKGLLEIWQLHMIHRDMKLANILLHFPDHPEVASMNRNQKRQFLATVDLTKVNFHAKISDFGLSTILDATTNQLSICGTPLYSAPQLLKRRGYSYKVDVWALGIMCYELLMGKTPFHSYEMQELLNKINEGRYVL
jgi:serine/threonine protein kinase